MAPNRSQAECPSCHRQFDTATAVICHLNHPYSSCTNWFIPPDSEPNSPSNPVQDDPDMPPPMKFPSASHVFGEGQGFMSNFHMDKFAEHCTRNIYYPFTSRDEWELGAFLTQSNMSMKAVNEFLSLELVSPCLSPSHTPSFSHFVIARYVTLTFLSRLQRCSVALLNSSPVDPSGSHRKSLFRTTLRRIQSWFITVILLSVSSGFSRIPCIPTVFVTPQNIELPLMATASMRIGSPAMACGLCRYARYACNVLCRNILTPSSSPSCHLEPLFSELSSLLTRRCYQQCQCHRFCSLRLLYTMILSSSTTVDLYLSL